MQHKRGDSYYFNLFIQKGMFHSHTCIQIITINGRIINLENQNKVKSLHFAVGHHARVVAATITYVINTLDSVELWKLYDFLNIFH